MDSHCCNYYGPIHCDCCRVSLGTVIFNIVRKNVLPTSDQLLAYMSLAMAAWFAVMFIIKFGLRLVKPILMLVATVLLYRFLRTFDDSAPKMSKLHMERPSLFMTPFKAVELFMRLLN